MYINRKKNIPQRQNDREYSMYVFIYYTNNKRFCLGYYDFETNLWMDSDGMIITEEFIWSYLPVKQMKAYIKNMKEVEKIY